MDSRLRPHPGLDFLTTEIYTGLTFANLARTGLGSDTDKATRNRRNARTAYESVLRFRGRVKLNSEQLAKLEAGLEKLRLALRELGETL